MGGVSEGECSSVEEGHGSLRRPQDEELDGHEALAGGIVAVAQRVANKTSGRAGLSSSIRQPHAVPADMVKCARFSEDELRVGSLIMPRTSSSAFASSSSSVEATTERTAFSPTNLATTCKPVARPARPYLAPPGPKTMAAATLGTTAVRAAAMEEPNSTLPTAQAPSSEQTNPDTIDHAPTSLPKFTDPRTCTWTSSHAANAPSEDRSSSLVNVLLQPLPPNFDSETQLPPLETEYTSLVRLSLWSVIDGHGGGCVATYASEVLLPHIAASVSRALGCAIVDRGVCVVNGQLRDANALDLDGLITTSDRSPANPNSIHYRSPYEDSNSEEEGDVDVLSRVQDDDEVTQDSGAHQSQASTAGASIASSLLHRRSPARSPAEETTFDPSMSSVKTSVKTAASQAARDARVGTHAPSEVAAVTRAITESFLAVDEGWINSIDPVATHQTSCQSNGRWNSGACALVVFTIQRLEWTSVSEADRERELRGPEKCRGHDTSQNKDAARRRMLDYVTRAKSASSVSTMSSTSSLTTAEDRVNASGLESEITETEGEEDDHSTDGEKSRRRNPSRREALPYRSIPKESLITAPGGCSCHCYRAYDALLYTAHVGDCRAVMLGSAPPRTIKVHGSASTGHPDATDDESSHHSSDETECLSSSDHDADSSDDEEIVDAETASAKKASSYMTYMRRPARRQRRRADAGANGPFIALPPLEGFRSVEIEMDSDGDFRGTHRRGRTGDPRSDSSSSSQESHDIPPAIILPPVTRPIDLTTDHSAYNPAEVTAVLRRCNNAPRAISAGVGGGIKRVAGSLAVTRALGDAYLKTPLLSFFPYKRHAPYITARPEVNCRPVVKDGDKVLILATDGVWERASGEDVLRWVRNFYSERIAEAERRKNRRLNNMNQADRGSNDGSVGGKQDDDSDDKHDATEDGNGARKRENAIGNGNGNSNSKDPRSPSPPAKRRKHNTWVPGTNNRDGCFGLASHRGSTVADVILRRVLNKVRRARNISSLQALMSLPPGRARRSKHDDITVSAVDLSAFVS